MGQPLQEKSRFVPDCQNGKDPATLHVSGFHIQRERIGHALGIGQFQLERLLIQVFEFWDPMVFLGFGTVLGDPALMPVEEHGVLEKSIKFRLHSGQVSFDRNVPVIGPIHVDPVIDPDRPIHMQGPTPLAFDQKAFRAAQRIVIELDQIIADAFSGIPPAVLDHLMGHIET